MMNLTCQANRSLAFEEHPLETHQGHPALNELSLRSPVYARDRRTTFLYDDQGQVVSGRRYWSDGTPVVGQQYDYAFDDIGNRTAAAMGGDHTGMNLRTATYTATVVNQYTNRTVPAALDTIGVANVGAVVAVNGDTNVYRRGEYFRKENAVTNNLDPVYFKTVVSATLGTNAPSSTGSVYVAVTPETFVHDPDGNLLRDGRWTNRWDAKNRLVEMVSLTNAPANLKRWLKFEYDWMGRRILKVASYWTNSAWSTPVTNRFLYDGWNLILIGEIGAAGTLVRSYAWGLDASGTIQGAGGVGGLLWVTPNGSPARFVAYDGNGNVVGLLDGTTATASANYEYGPFGEVIRATGSVAKANPFRFATQYSDDESDIVWYPRRPYSPSTGRWLSRDPIEEEGGENLYIFCGNDSLNNWDLLGEKWKVERTGGARASALTERDDRVADLASLVGLGILEDQRWLTAPSRGTIPASAYEQMTGCERFETPNTVIAYWAGNLGWAGRWYVR